MQENIENESIRQFKYKVKRLHKMLKVHIPSLKLGHCFACLSRLSGHSDWYALRVRLIKGDEFVDDIVSCDLRNKADKLYCLLQTRSANITVQDCYECLHCVYPTGNTDREDYRPLDGTNTKK